MYLDQLQLGLVGVTDVGNKRWCFRFLGTLGAKPLGMLTRSSVMLWADSLATQQSVLKKKPLISLRFVAMRCFSALLTWCADRHDDLVNLPLLTRKRRMRYAVEPRRILSWNELTSLRSTLADLAEGRRATLAPVNMLRLLQVQIDLYGDGLLFPNPRTGRPFLHTSASRIAATAEIKKPTEVTCHTPRRSFADSAHQAGGSIEEIALTLGNTPEVVLKHYLSRSVSPSARRINRLMNPEG